jgi:Zn-dependent protease with chaperone function
MLGICLVLASLLTINVLASLMATAFWWVIDSPARRWSARHRARTLFAIRIGPIAAASMVIGFLLIPSYLAYEPYSTTEVVSKKLAAVALVSAVGIAFALWRGLRSWFITRALVRQWIAVAEPVAIAGLRIPAFRIKHSFPVMAVVGSLRPRLFVANHVLDSLSEDEVLAAIAHEHGHLAARDNLKRMLLRVCCDMLAIVPCGKTLDHAWTGNSEAAADEYAASLGPSVALNLASALIKIARMAPAGARPTMPAAVFLLGEESDGIMGRVNRLINLAAGGCRPKQISRFLLWGEKGIVFILLTGLIIVLGNTQALASIHGAMEHLLRLLN